MRPAYNPRDKEASSAQGWVTQMSRKRGLTLCARTESDPGRLFGRCQVRLSRSGLHDHINSFPTLGGILVVGSPNRQRFFKHAGQNVDRS